MSTVEEEELSALMGEKEDYNKDDEQNEEQWRTELPHQLTGRL